MPTRNIGFIHAAIVALTINAHGAPAYAHEFWIDPEAGQSLQGATISADMRVGQNFSGAALPFLDTTVKSITHWSFDTAVSIDAKLGDRPAISTLPLEDRGLQSVVIETHPAYIVFDTFSEFEEYLADEGLGHIADRHRQRGLPDTDIAEAYIRNARALLQVGPIDSSQVDSPTGLPFEIVVKGNPFSVGITMLYVHLLWGGNPMGDARISVFYLPDGGTAPEDTVKAVVQTDAAGLAGISLPGPGRYLVNAVRLDPVDGPGSVVWQSHWASLTFEITSSQ